LLRYGGTEALSTAWGNAIVSYSFLIFKGQWLVLWPHCPVHNCLLTTVVMYLLIAANKD